MEKDIIELVKGAEEKACRDSRTGVIISPGAMGDCLLMLPLAKFMKQILQLGGIDFIGHTDYIEFYPGRTVVDGIRSIDSVDFYRLFTKPNDFIVEDSEDAGAMRARTRELWKLEWKYFTEDEMMSSPRVDGEFQGLGLPDSVIEKIYRSNAENWIPGV